MSKTKLHNRVVYVLRTGGVYRDYDTLAKELGATNFNAGGWLNINHLFRVIDIGIHSDGTRAVALIRSLVDDNEYCINSCDLEIAQGIASGENND